MEIWYLQTYLHLGELLWLWNLVEEGGAGGRPLYGVAVAGFLVLFCLLSPQCIFKTLTLNIHLLLPPLYENQIFRTDTRRVRTDFWTTRCTNCPAALDALDALARERPSVNYVGVNIDDASLARELVAKAASEGRWTRYTLLRLYLFISPKDTS